MEQRLVLVETAERVATIRLNAPEKRNALSEPLTEELIAAIRRADADPEVHAIVLTGNGPAFCAGADIGELRESFEKPAPQLYAEGRAAAELFKLGALVRTPLIAAVNGPALGGGCGLVAMCHLAIASDRATLGTPELRLGLAPFVIMPWIRRAVGHKKALELMLTAAVLTAEQAREIGLVQWVVPHEQLETEAQALARQIAGFSSLPVRLALDGFFETEELDLLKAFDYLSTIRLVSFLSEDLREGTTAFFERRQPEWKGR